MNEETQSNYFAPPEYMEGSNLPLEGSYLTLRCVLLQENSFQEQIETMKNDISKAARLKSL